MSSYKPESKALKDQLMRQREIRIAELRLKYKATNNALYVWEAINLLTRSDSLIPNWVSDYLQLSSTKIRELEFKNVKSFESDICNCLNLSSKKGRGTPLTKRNRTDLEYEIFMYIAGILSECSDETLDALTNNLSSEFSGDIYKTGKTIRDEYFYKSEIRRYLLNKK